MRPAVSPAPAETRGPVSVHPWAYPHEEVLRRFDVNPLTGLTVEEAARRRGALGPNLVETDADKTVDGAATQPWWAAVAEWTGVQAMVDAVRGRRIAPDHTLTDVEAGRQQFQARVLRSDRVLSVPAVDLVPGDIVLLAQGDLVPADARLLDVVEMRVDEEPLTGGELASSRCVAPVGNGWTPVADRRSMIHAGSRVVHGAGTAVVVATGPLTVLGRATMLRATPLRSSVGRGNLGRAALRPGRLGRRGGLGAGASRRTAGGPRATESAAPAGLPWLPSAAPPSRRPAPVAAPPVAVEPAPCVTEPVVARRPAGPRPLVLGSRPARAARSARRWTRSCGY
ncbi:cation-transporting P-type ATPase [Cryptosporangium aurantiacum]|uniref:Cation transporter/ATPase, N-terminus n=1 Tax=Cryptosporangium aurantiacum TaxID=134849 RepID=A0A1M7PUI1_9ACTN|nr:cation-transporting P-type ATPase [Cryptosporangium aurantiacum]SHN21089.1 Cation transporter/ATPase, N-terminus [Cryptosporangium aurantiacum]